MWMIANVDKTFGMPAYPNAELAADPAMAFQMLKEQGAISICVTLMRQVAWLRALQTGSPWVRLQVQDLSSTR